MRIEIDPVGTDDRPSSGHDVPPDRDAGWSADELARLRSEWDAEPGHR